MFFGFQTTNDWLTIFKQIGTVGVICVFLGIVIWKKLIPMIQSTIDDARKDRDANRQLLKEQAIEFTAHIRRENEEFRSSLKDVVDTFERTRSKR